MFLQLALGIAGMVAFFFIHPFIGIILLLFGALLVVSDNRKQREKREAEEAEFRRQMLSRHD